MWLFCFPEAKPHYYSLECYFYHLLQLGFHSFIQNPNGPICAFVVIIDETLSVLAGHNANFYLHEVPEKKYNIPTQNCSHDKRHTTLGLYPEGYSPFS